MSEIQVNFESSLNLWLYLQRGILKFSGVVCWLNLKMQRALCHLRAIKTESAQLNLKPLRAFDKFRHDCQPAASVKFKILQTRIGAVLNGTTIRCVKFYYFARAASDFEMASAGQNFKIPLCEWI